MSDPNDAVLPSAIPASRPRRLIAFVFVTLIAASAVAATIVWPTLQLDVCYKDWTATAYWDRAELTRRKRWSFLPGPAEVRTTITLDRYHELEKICVGREYIGPRIIIRTGENSHLNDSAPFNFGFDDPDGRIFLSEGVIDEEMAELETPSTSTP